MPVPEYLDGEDLTHYADDHGIEKNTLVRSRWDKATYQATTVTETYVAFDNGEKHTHLALAHAVEHDAIEILGTRAVREAGHTAAGGR